MAPANVFGELLRGEKKGRFEDGEMEPKAKFELVKKNLKD